MEKLSGVPVVASIKDNVKFLEALSKVKPLVMHSPYSAPALEYKKLAAALIGEQYKDPRMLSRLSDMLFKDRSREAKNRHKIYKDRVKI